MDLSIIETLSDSFLDNLQREIERVRENRHQEALLIKATEAINSKGYFVDTSGTLNDLSDIFNKTILFIKYAASSYVKEDQGIEDIKIECLHDDNSPLFKYIIKNDPDPDSVPDINGLRLDQISHDIEEYILNEYYGSNDPVEGYVVISVPVYSRDRSFPSDGNYVVLDFDNWIVYDDAKVESGEIVFDNDTILTPEEWKLYNHLVCITPKSTTVETTE